ncbi:MAG TPA: AMP-binding protein, partial [Gammaproteobacteria bacterium]|nr:AMP-binding protein [Gammaproteobacteria bacterium]
MTQPGSNRSYFHRGGEQPLLGATIAEHFAATAAQHPDRDAVVSVPQQRCLGYRQLAVEVDRLARGLLGIGVGKGDRVGIWSTNNIEWLLLQLATARIGAILVNINPAYRPGELAYALQRSGVQYLFTIPAFRSSDYVAMLVELLPELTQKPGTEAAWAALPSLQHVVIYD